MKNDLKIWQLNLLIALCHEKVQAEEKKVYHKLDPKKVNTEEDTKQFKELLNEMKANQFTELGKANLTLEKLQFMLNDIDAKAKAALNGEVIDGWHCFHSPDKVCHYHSEQRSDGFYVELKDGSNYKILQTYTKEDHENENEDCCIFCKEPEERK